MQVGLERHADLGAGPVQQDTLVGGGQAKDGAGLVGRPPLDVAQDDDGPVVGGQVLDRGQDPAADLVREQEDVGVPFPQSMPTR